MADYIDKIKEAGKKFLIGATLAYSLGGGIGVENSYAQEANKKESVKKEQITPITLESSVNKVMLSDKFLRRNPEIRKDILTYTQDGEEFLCLPPQLLDYEVSKKSPELTKAEIVEDKNGFKVKRYYQEKKNGKVHYDEVKIDNKTVEELVDYFKRKGFDQDPEYLSALEYGVGANLAGAYIELGYLHKGDNDTSFSIRTKFGGKNNYEVETVASNDNESIILGKSREEVEQTNGVPTFYRDEITLAKLIDETDKGKMMRISFADEKLKNQDNSGNKYGEWEEKKLKKPEYGEYFISRNNLGFLYVCSHDGRDAGTLFAITQRDNSSTSAKQSNKELLTRKLTSIDHDTTPIGNHSVKRELDVGYNHGSFMAEYTEWFLGGKLALIPMGTGRSTRTYPMELYGKPGSRYSAIAFGPDTILDIIKNVTGAEDKGGKKSLFKEVLENISVKIVKPWKGKANWLPEIRIKELGRKDRYNSGR